MDYNTAIIKDRLDDIESQLLELNHQVTLQNKSVRLSRRPLSFIYLLLVPLVALIFFMIGLDITYQTENRSVSYNNDSLTELALGTLTILSSLYSLKKHRESTITEDS